MQRLGEGGRKQCDDEEQDADDESKIEESLLKAAFRGLKAVAAAENSTAAQVLGLHHRQGDKRNTQDDLNDVQNSDHLQLPPVF